MRTFTLSAIFRAGAAVFSLAALGIACESDPPATAPAPPPATGATATVTVTSSVPPLSAPPALTAAAASGGSQVMGIGSYCWDNICIDKAGIITSAQPFVVTRAERISVATAPARRQLAEAVLTSRQATGQPASLSGGEVAWSPLAASSPVQTQLAGGVVTFVADMPPGRYVLSLFLRFDRGDASYGLLLEVR
jgi:hypothetical protein